jgi:glucose-6-phosphate isomerase
VEGRPILSLFAADPGRAQGFSVTADGMLFDYSKTNIDAQGRACCWRWPRPRTLRGAARRCSAGEKINDTEGRAVLHVALRAGEMR